MKQLPRFAILSAPVGNGIARVAAAEAHHMRDVMRLRPGDAVTLIDEGGATWSGTIAAFDRDGAEVRVGETETRSPRLPLILAPAIVKGPRMDFIIEKAAELGATELWPIVCARSVGKPPGREKTQRWTRLATAASKQSLALPPMRVTESRTFGILIQSVPRDTLAVICSADAEPMMQVIEKMRPQAILIATGPEGDFDPSEMDAALSAAFVPVGLGSNRLRSETAAIAAMAIAAQWQSELR